MDKEPFVVISLYDLYGSGISCYILICFGFSCDHFFPGMNLPARLQYVRSLVFCRCSDGLHGVSAVFDADWDDPSGGRPLWRYPAECDATRGAGASAVGDL